MNNLAKVLVTGSAGHLGEALMRSLKEKGTAAIGIDIVPSTHTDLVGSIVDRDFVREAMVGCDSVIHTATLHKPHIATHTRQSFIDTNISGTLNLLEEAVARQCRAFVYTSTTSTYGDAMNPEAGEAAVWVTESLRAKPKNIYGVTKTSAEDICQLFQRRTALPCLILKTSRFFSEEDDDVINRTGYEDANLKVNELLSRRVDIEDAVDAHHLALEKAPQIGFDRFIISAPTPFAISDAKELGQDAPAVLHRCVPEYLPVYEQRGWSMFATLGRVYDSRHAQQRLNWEPKYTFAQAILRLNEGADYRSPLAIDIGKNGDHCAVFKDGPYPITRF